MLRNRDTTAVRARNELQEVREWGRILFTDESRFCLRSPNGRQRVWRRTGERVA
ncbi:unnamed protein product, partial [Tenebrio molitor]